MESSLCSSFVPGSSVAPGGAWTPLPLYPAALPCEGPAALLAGQTKRLNSVMCCLRRLMKFTVTWSFSGYILAVTLHVTGLCSSAHHTDLTWRSVASHSSHWLQRLLGSWPFTSNRYLRCTKDGQGFILNLSKKKKRKKSTIYIHINHIEESHKLFKGDKRHSGTEKCVFFFHPRNTNSEISPQYLKLLVMSWAVNAEIPKFLQMHVKNNMFLTCSSVETSLKTIQWPCIFFAYQINKLLFSGINVLGY